MSIAFLCSNSQSSLLQRIFAERHDLSDHISSVISTNSQFSHTYLPKHTHYSYFQWNSRNEGSRILSTLLREHSPSVLIALFDKIIDLSFFIDSECCLLNLHPSLLPSFKGMHAYDDSIDAGVTINGATLHEIDVAVDSGKILGQVAYAFDPFRPSQEQLHIKHMSEYFLITSYLSSYLGISAPVTSPVDCICSLAS